MGWRRPVVVVCVVLLAGLVGCSARVATFSPDVNPVVAATSTPKDQQALDAEAESVLRQFLELNHQVKSSGGSATVPPEIAALITAPFSDFVLGVYQSYRSDRVQVRNADKFTIVSLTPAKLTAVATQVKDAAACIRTQEDFTKVQTKSLSDPVWRPGELITSEYTFVSVGGKLKIASITSAA